MFLLFDIGGTNIRVAYSPDGETIGEPIVFDTPTDISKAVSEIAHAAEKLGALGNIDAAAGGVPGILDMDKTKLLMAPNLHKWEHEPLQKKLCDALGVPVHLENDSALVGLGEAVHGAGKNARIVEYMTVSTGVGGARIVEGMLDERSVGFEPGHEIFAISRGKITTLEDEISGTAVEKRFGKKPKQITNPEVWEELAEKLALGLHNTIVMWSPDVVVLGGSMITGNPAIPIDRVEFHLKNHLHIFPQAPEIKIATLGNMGGLWGALEFVKTI